MSGYASPGFVAPMRRILGVGGLGFVVAMPIAVAIGIAVAGSRGAWGAAIGIALAVGFFGVTIVLALLTARLQPTTFAVATLGGWLVKLILLLGALAALRDADFYSRSVLLGALLVGTAGSLAIETLVVSRARVPYTEPASHSPAAS